jgi:hypothetical protein
VGFPITNHSDRAAYEAARIAVTYTLLEGGNLKTNLFIRPYTVCSIHPNFCCAKELDGGREANWVSSLHGSENHLR